MPLESPQDWWKPLGREEKIWCVLIVIFGALLFFMMPAGHLIGKQNVSQETYKTTPAEFRDVTNRFIAAYQRKDVTGKPVVDQGFPVVEPPEGDVFLVARAWAFEPILVLKKGKTYRIHMSSLDFQHGFSLQPQNLNFQILPGYDFVVTMVPRESGEFHLICNEYCFYAGPKAGHDTMVGKIIVEE